ncbi:MAG: hypothetical protein M3Y33_20890 [Actinomycetota bacterium]|nr:hypothetical protein [Actinomycetota bacterium]
MVGGLLDVAALDLGFSAELRFSVEYVRVDGISALEDSLRLHRHHLPGHTMATALTDGYTAGLIAAAAIFGIGAVVAVASINSSISADELSPH